MMKNRPFTPILFMVMSVIFLMTPSSHALDNDVLDDILYPKTEKTISMDFTEAKLNNVLKIFSQQAGLNFIVSSDIAGTLINIYLDKVPVERALEQILAANNLTYELDPDSNILFVKKLGNVPTALMTRVYPLKFATVPSSKMFTTLSAMEGGSSSPASGDSGGIVSAIESVLSSEGKVVEDARTNSLIISDIPGQFPLIEQAITRLDVRIPQILIEAEMLDISSATADKMGVKYNNSNGPWINYTGPSRNTLYPFEQDRLDGHGDSSGLLTKSYTAGSFSLAGIDVILDFLRGQTDTKNLARPRILTLNNSTAEIAIKTDEAIGETQSQTAVEGLGTASTEAERVETGVFLRVTPQVNLNTREITMAIEPKVIQATQSLEFDFKDPEERGAKSILRVYDGDTIIIGGLIRTESEKIKTSVPLIGSIPVIGAPFRHKDTSDSNRELIIFITPHIVEEELSAMDRQHGRNKKITREQSKPSGRNHIIDKELSYMEDRKF